jgi:putative intracellular protease/amidase
MKQRRDFLRAATLLTLLRVGGVNASETAKQSASQHSTHDMSGIPEEWKGNEKIAMLLYPGFTALDFVGPQYMFGNLMGAQIYLVSKTLEPVMSDTKLAIMPNATYDDVPKELDIFFVPGAGSAIFDFMEDHVSMDFVKDRAPKAKLLASVCTGSVILGKAGLLKGKKVTSHWISRQELEVFGATPVNERVVWDGNLITGAGVSAGLDLGLEVIGKLKGDFFAESIQLLAEYDPRPRYRSGSLELAKPKVRRLMEQMFVGFRKKIRTLAK